MFASNGEALPPCGVPSSLHVPLSFFQHAAFSHFWMSRTTRWSAIRCSTNFTSHSWSIASKNAADVAVEHPVHLLRQQPGVQGVQRMVLTPARPESVREAEKVRLVDGIQHLDRRALDYLVFQRRDAERSLPPVVFGDEHSTHWLRSVRPAPQPSRRGPGDCSPGSLRTAATFPHPLPERHRASARR